MDDRTIQISHIPLIPNKQVLVDFLEEIIGKGSVRACNLATPKSLKSKAKMCAFVQFEDAETASVVYNLARAGILIFWCATLTAQFVQKEMPQSPPTCLEGVKLHMGCQISQNAFSVLHSSPEAIFEFGFDMRRINLYVNERPVVYKMEFTFRDIRQIHGYNIKGIEGTKVFLLQGIQEYFANYMINDSLGVISNSHTVFADQDESMARSLNCLQLAELHSTAVDFPKTGIPAQIPFTLHPKEYPDFMEKKDKPSYESKRILGKLYRSVKEVATQILCISLFTKEVAQRAYDPDLEVEGFRNHIREALEYKILYNSKLATLIDHYEIKSEAEIISGNISSLSAFDGNEKHGDLKEAIMLAVNSLKMEARGWLEESSSTYNQFAKASAWYHVTYHPDYWGYGDSERSDDSNPHFVSFPWVIYDKLLRIKQNRRSHGI